MNMRRLLRWGGICVAALGWGFIGIGCARLQPVSEVRARLLPSGEVEYEGRAMQVETFPGRLRAAGAGSATTIYVDIPENASQEELSRIVTMLHRAGYVRVLFVTPRHTEVE